MATSAQIAANQINAQSSTGPRTPDGKAASSQNAVKHGATSTRVVLASEDPAQFERVSAEFFRQLKPATWLERFLVDDIVAAHWRMKRMQNIIRAWMDRAATQHPSRNATLAQADLMLSPEIAKLTRYEAQFRRAFESSWAKLKELQKKRVSAENEPKSARPSRPIADTAPTPLPERVMTAAADAVPLTDQAPTPPRKS